MTEKIRFCDPIGGVICYLTDEDVKKGKDRIECLLTAPEGHLLEVNGRPCLPAGEVFTVSLPFEGKSPCLRQRISPPASA